MNRVDVLDHGYIILQDHMGSDLTPVNAARVSFDKRADFQTATSDIDQQPDGDGWRRVRSHNNDWSEWERLHPRDQKLLSFLARENHTSPFRHAMLQFECYAPLMVARQHWKYRVGSAFEEPDADYLDGWNESSRRYVTEEPVFYVPTVWRSSPTNLKQGSGEPIDSSFAVEYTNELKQKIQRGLDMYNNAINDGMAPEQARGLLDGVYFMYVRYYWTVSLAGLIHFLNQRLAEDAQHEIVQYAKACHELAYPLFPRSMEAFGLDLR